MTSASELFYNRRSRFGRNSDPFDDGSDFGSSSPLDRGNRRHRHSANPHHHSSNWRRDRIDPDGCDPLRRVPHHSRQPSLHRSFHPHHERESIRLEHVGHQFASGNVTRSGNQNNVQDRARFSGNDRLPGAVLLARERLLHRLGSVTLSDSRQSNRSSSSNHHNDLVIGDELRLVDAGDWETDISREWPSTIASVTDSVGQQMSMRPPGLTQEALNCLRMEVFCVPEVGNEEDISSMVRECSICLETFLEGDELICLPCGHRYHFCCLDPWVRACGDCPYCRRGIVVTMNGVSETPEC